MKHEPNAWANNSTIGGVSRDYCLCCCGDLALYGHLPMTSAASVALPDSPETLPQLIGLLRVGVLVSGECSLCHDIMLGRISPEIEPALQLIKEVFAKHIRAEHSAST
jgi:hypothetical protein